MPAPCFKQGIWEMLPSPFTTDDAKRVANDLGCAASTVAAWGRTFGKVGPGRPDKLPPAEEVIALIEEGIRPASIARSFGTTRPAIYSCLRSAGFKLRKGKVTAIEKKSKRSRVTALDRLAA